MAAVGGDCLGAAVDSACTSHMFNSLDGCVHFEKCDVSITVAGGREIRAVGRGKYVRTFVNQDGSSCAFTFNNVLYVPCLTYDLVSTRQLDLEGYCTVFSNGECVISKHEGHHLYGKLDNGLYRLRAPFHEACASALSGIDLLHRRMGHASKEYLKKFLKKGERTTLSFCDACALTRAKRRPFRTTVTDKPHATRPLSLVVSDLCGPFRIASLQGFRYFMTLIDVYSIFIFVCFLRTKDAASTKIEQWFVMIKAQIGTVPTVFQSDGGGEYTGNDTRAVFHKNGTKFITTAAGSSNQNAIAERANRTLLESARAMMNVAGAPRYLWEEAVAYATVVRNLTPHSGIGFSSPGDVFPLSWFSVKRVLPYVKVWGCKCFVTDADCKLSTNSREGTFVGLDSTRKAWRVLYAQTRQIVASRNVTFDESRYPGMGVLGRPGNC